MNTIYQIDPRPSVPILEDPGYFEDEGDNWIYDELPHEDYDEEFWNDLGHEIDEYGYDDV